MALMGFQTQLILEMHFAMPNCNAGQRGDGAVAQAAVSSSTTAPEDQRVATGIGRAQLIPGALAGQPDPRFEAYR